ncbi:MAG: hypothetical protein JKY96_00485, partial [Phycisphaerales bacterium]|nr:hypothetical protein [Phycisphaerales bacterium]
MHTLHAPYIEVSNEQQDAPIGASSFVPASPGVLVFLADGGQSILVSAASDMRTFVGDRLGHRDHAISPRVDLHAVTRSIRAYRTGIGLETQWVLARLAGEHSADLYADLGERAMVYFVCPFDDPMRWGVVDSDRLEARDPEIQMRCVGPIARKSDADSICAAMDDAFSLCRYPKELALAPHGKPCAYKDMGKCPAACDGSESIEAFGERFAQSVEFVGSGIRAGIDRCQRAITKASGAMDFEGAGEHKGVLDAASAIAIERVEHARSLDGYCALVFTPSVRRGWVGVWVFGHHGLEMIAAVEQSARREELTELLACARRIRGLGEVDKRSAM